MKNKMLFRLVSGRVKESALSYINKIDINPNKPLVIIIQPEEQGRTARQNRYLWGVVYATIEREDCGIFGSEFNQRFLGTMGLKVIDLIHEYCKQMFLTGGGAEELAVSYQRVAIRPSTAHLSAKDFAEYVRKIQAHASVEWGIYIPDPSPSDCLSGFSNGGYENEKA